MSKVFVYNKRTESYAYAARNAATLGELERASVGLDIADIVSLGKVDLWLAKHALSAVYRNLKRYPNLRRGMHYFGTLNGFKNNSDAVITNVFGQADFFTVRGAGRVCNDIAEQTLNAFKYGNALASAFCAMCGDRGISGIIVNGKSMNTRDILYNLAAGERSGHSPKGCNSVKAVMDHEFGHICDFMLGISNSNEFRKIMSGYTAKTVADGLSKYAANGGEIHEREVVAEAFSEYMNNPSPRRLAAEIGVLINKKYVDYN